MQDNGSLLSILRRRLKALQLIDVLVYLTGLMGLVAFFPKVEQQMRHVVTFGDLVWYLAVDFALLNLLFIAMWILIRILHAIDKATNKKADYHG